MLVAVKIIGELLEKSNQKIEDATEGKILILNINTSSNDFKITIEDYNPNKINSYLYKKGTSKGNTPAPFVPKTDIQRSFDKIFKWISNAVKEIEKDISKIEKALQILNKKKNKILKELKDKLSEYSKKEIKFITLNKLFRRHKFLA